jgi:hypothetical protein
MSLGFYKQDCQNKTVCVNVIQICKKMFAKIKFYV